MCRREGTFLCCWGTNPPAWIGWWYRKGEGCNEDREHQFADVDYAGPSFICLFSVRLWEVSHVSFLVSSSGSKLLVSAVPKPFFPPEFHPCTTAVDLRPPQIPQSAKLWLIHHIKCPLAFHSLCVDYSNVVLLIFGIRQKTYLLMNSNYLALLSSCTKPRNVCSHVS